MPRTKKTEVAPNAELDAAKATGEVAKETKKKKKPTISEVLGDIVIDDVDISTKVKIPKETKEYLASLKDDAPIIDHLVGQYYQAQQFRIRAENQVRSLIQGYASADQEHNEFLMANLQFAKQQEELNKEYLNIITNDIPICRWMRSIVGIGPIFAAILYTSFDVTKAGYATNFLSYAGLNDNNNPWLGTEKSKILVKNVLEWEEGEYKKLVEEFLDNTGLDLTSLSKKEISAVIDKVNDKYTKQFKRYDMQKKTDRNKVAACIGNIYFNQRGELIEGYLDIFNKLYRDVAIDSSAFERYPFLFEYVTRVGEPKFMGNMAIAKIASMTTRNPENIKKGIIASMLSKFNNKKDEKVTIYCPTSAEVTSYLAKPPYNTNLKKMCYLIGESFMKQRNRGSLYGKIYAERYASEIIRNDNLEFKDQAVKLLQEKNYKPGSEIYKTLSSGKLTTAHIMSRSKRYATKLFISHVYEAMYYEKYRTQPPMPYIIEFGGHHDYIAPEVDYKQFL